MFKLSVRLDFLAVGFFFLGACSAIGASPLFLPRALGTLGSDAAMASGLNASGSAVGFITDVGGNQRPVSFSDGSAVQLGGIGQASGINDAGTIVGTTFSGTSASVTEWSAQQAKSPTIAGYGNAINNSGEIAGAYYSSANQLHAFLYADNTLVDLNTLGGSWSSASAINSNGQVVGTSTLADHSSRAFFYSGGALEGLGTLGGVNSYGAAVNDLGQVVGAAQTAAGYPNAFSWTSGGIADLGTLGGSTSAAYGVNNSGQVVGYSLTTGNAATHGFLDNAGVMLDLNDLLPAGSGWTITAAYGINNAGEIVGNGLYNGQSYALELDPSGGNGTTMSSLAPATAPEPSSLLLLGLGLIFLARIGRRRTEPNLSKDDNVTVSTRGY